MRKFIAAAALAGAAIGGVAIADGASAAGRQLGQRCAGLVVTTVYGKDPGCAIRQPQIHNVLIPKFGIGGYSWAVQQCGRLGGSFSAPAGNYYHCDHVFVA
jgi:hypothetical protein